MIDPTLPIIDLHRHLDGNVRLDTILDLGRQHNLPLPAWDVEGLRPFVRVIEPRPSLMDFIAKFRWMTAVMVDYDACRRIAYENVEDAYREGLDYAELRFSPWFMSEPHGLNPIGVVEAVTDGVAEALRSRRFRVKVKLILRHEYEVAAPAAGLTTALVQQAQRNALTIAFLTDEERYELLKEKA
jgi:adenosine deaminase